MDADLARQAEERERIGEVDGRRVPALGQARPLRLLAVAGLAELDIGAEAAGADRDLEAGLGIHAEAAGAVAAELAAIGVLARDGELAGEAALGIVRAADEGAELAELERQPAVAAGRALARVAALGARREDVRAEQLVQRLQHLGDAEVVGLGDVGRELPPELAEHLLPGDVAVRDLVELLLEVGGEVVFDIALEEALEEGGDQPALVLGDELLLLEPDIAAVAEHGERRGVGGGPADAELLHAS